MRDMMTLLAYEAKRRPDIAILVERCVDMTDAEIEAAQVPMKWFKQALRRKRDLGLAARMTVDIENSPHLRTFYLPDLTGEVFEYRGCDDYIGLGRGGALHIRYQEYFFLPDGGGVWVDHHFGPLIDPKLNARASLGRMTRMAFKALDQARKLRNCPADAQVINLTGGASTARPMGNPLMSQYGVRIG